MHNQTPETSDLAPLGAVAALVERDAASALTHLVPGQPIADSLDRHYGRNGWFVFWDEDLRGRPVPGTIQLAYGRETLVLG